MTMRSSSTGRRESRRPAYDKWYKTKEWQALRADQLARHPYCQCPHHRGLDRTAVATRVDHTEPHEGDRRKFWNRANLQSLTTECHDKYKQSQERGGHGFLVGSDEDGWPLDPNHPAMRE